mmetsp:Transcript_32214/g.92703  ORF Transcript_32214/g.92703 Transcript_32214/m.92703 type:complete len:306 (-) Transcript_32214:921-1838(-)
MPAPRPTLRTASQGLLMWFRMTSAMTWTPAALQRFTMSCSCSLLPERDSSLKETGWYLVHQAPPSMCSVTGATCTPSKPFGPRNSSHSLATSWKLQSHSWMKTGLLRSLPPGPATVSPYWQCSLYRAAPFGSPTAAASRFSREVQRQSSQCPVVLPDLISKASALALRALAKHLRAAVVSWPKALSRKSGSESEATRSQPLPSCSGETWHRRCGFGAWVSGALQRRREAWQMATRPRAVPSSTSTRPGYGRLESGSENRKQLVVRKALGMSMKVRCLPPPAVVKFSAGPPSTANLIWSPSPVELA